MRARWTLGEYDFVIIYEAPVEKAGLKAALPWAKFCKTQTMVAIPNEEAKKIAFKKNSPFFRANTIPAHNGRITVTQIHARISNYTSFRY